MHTVSALMSGMDCWVVVSNLDEEATLEAQLVGCVFGLQQSML